MLETHNAADQRRGAADHSRQALLTGLPVTEHRRQLAGISTAVLEGGDGAPLVLLHGPGGYAAHWMRVIPGLVTTHRVIAPDLPGHGTSQVTEGSLDVDRVLGWLGELIDRTCPSPPTLVGQALGGAIAARFACDHSDRLSRLVLVDGLGLSPFEPAPEIGLALNDFLAQPTEASHDRLWRYCAFDFEGLREDLGQRWDQVKAYNVDRVSQPSVQAALGALMEQLAMAPIASADLKRIKVPTTLIWGRHDLVVWVGTAEMLSARLGWPLHIIENAAADPHFEQPEAFLTVLRSVLDQERTSNEFMVPQG